MSTLKAITKFVHTANQELILLPPLRLSRLAYLKRMLFWYGFILALSLALMLFMSSEFYGTFLLKFTELEPKIPHTPKIILGSIISSSLLFAFVALSITVHFGYTQSRLRDCNVSALWAFAIVPLGLIDHSIYLMFLTALLLWPGTKGLNQYGYADQSQEYNSAAENRVKRYLIYILIMNILLIPYFIFLKDEKSPVNPQESCQTNSNNITTFLGFSLLTRTLEMVLDDIDSVKACIARKEIEWREQDRRHKESVKAYKQWEDDMKIYEKNKAEYDEQLKKYNDAQKYYQSLKGRPYELFEQWQDIKEQKYCQYPLYCKTKGDNPPARNPLAPIAHSNA